MAMNSVYCVNYLLSCSEVFSFLYHGIKNYSLEATNVLLEKHNKYNVQRELLWLFIVLLKMNEIVQIE